jgi:hypothetical protein
MSVRATSRRFGAAALVIGPLSLVLGSLFQVAGDDSAGSTGSSSGCGTIRWRHSACWACVWMPPPRPRRCCPPWSARWGRHCGCAA